MDPLILAFVGRFSDELPKPTTLEPRYPLAQELMRADREHYKLTPEVPYYGKP